MKMLLSVPKAARDYALDKEPVAVFSGLAAAAAALHAFVVDAQGSLTGQNAWLAVAWAAATWLGRRFATPASKAVSAADAEASRADDAESTLRWLGETSELYRGEIPSDS